MSRSLLLIVAAVLVALCASSSSFITAAYASPINAQFRRAPDGGLVKRLRAGIPIDSASQDVLARIASPEGVALKNQAQSHGLTCAECENYAALVLLILKNETLIDNVTDVYKKQCNAAYGKNTTEAAVCKEVAKYILKVLPKLMKKLEEKGWDIPFNLCAILFDNICTQDCCSSSYAPEQVYINLADGNDFSRMRVTWVTLRKAEDANVQFKKEGDATYQTVAVEAFRTYTFAGWIGTINTAVLTGLAPSTKYFYNVGSSFNRTGDFFFNTFPTNIGSGERPLRILYVADMSYGGWSDNTVLRVGERAQKGDVDMIIHNGDISYADGFMLHWDMFMRKVSTFAPYVPYMTNPGNHEIEANFSSYRNRLANSMPKDPNTLEGAMYYSLNIGPTRILMMDSETPVGTADIPEPEVKWASDVLSSQDRKAQPWSLVFHHRPLYCDEDSDDCKKLAFLLRLQVESTYIKNKVDFVGTGHVHYYIRSWPMSMGAVTMRNYTNADAPIYVVNGAAGNHGPNLIPDKSQSATFPGSSNGIGYGIMTVSSNMPNNKHRILYEFFDAEKDTLVDSFTIDKTM